MKIFQKISVITLLTVINSCAPLEDYRQFTDRDIRPPMFISMGSTNPNTLELQFSEKLLDKPEYLVFDPAMEITDFSVDMEKIQISFAEDLEPGGLYKIEITVCDLSGNSLTLIADFYGYNSNLPDLIINEFTSQGSSTNPDKVELRVLSDGNTAGICIYEGIDTEWKQRKILPSIDVHEDDYIIVHFKPAGTAEEIDETTSKDTSGGLNVHPEAWDLWVEGGSGLSGNNGTITMFTNPRGSLIDGILYSNRTSGSDENYRGFGSTATMNKADRLFESGGWLAEGDLIAPEDALDPEDSTATRSMCRESVYTDINSSMDWHIVPTSTASFGEINSDLIYIP
ncbi:MAG: hypothetical protein DRP58_06910 [Spirochaetes bacterium]|nr:MAG: hypothetical protein DRP58_06910 [Spirochaetota bacterium]